MAFKLLQEATHQSKFSDNKKKTIMELEQAVGKEAARRLVEAYQVSEEDYVKWLDVVRGFAKDEGLNIKTKNIFAEVAGSVLENDPAPIDEDMKAAIINVLWAKFKAQLTHSKVEKVSRAKEEEEQLNFALKKMKCSTQEDEEYVRGKKVPFDPEFAAQVQREYKNSQRRNVLYTKPDEYGDYDSESEDKAYSERERARRYANRFNPEEDEELSTSDQRNIEELNIVLRNVKRKRDVELKNKNPVGAAIYDKQIKKYTDMLQDLQRKTRGNQEEDEELNPPDMEWDDELDDVESEQMGNALSRLSKHTIADLEPPTIPSFKKSFKPKRKFEEEESEFSQLFKQAQGMEDEEWDDDSSLPDDFEDDDFDEDDLDPPKSGQKYSAAEELEPPREPEDDDFDEDSMEPPTIPGKFRPDDMNDEDDYDPSEYGDDDTRGRSWDQEDEEDTDELSPPDIDDRGYDDEDFELPYNNKYDDLDDEDREIVHRGSRMKKDRELDDFDSASDEGMDQDMNITSKGDRYSHERDLEDFDSNDDEYEHEPVGNGSYLKPKRSFKDSMEDEELADKGSKFKKGQVVTCKKDGKQYKVEIPDGPGDYTGVFDGGRIRMIATKDLEAIKQVEDEESTSKQPSRVSFLHDILTGAKTTTNLKKLQAEIEDEAANAWTTHHAKLPKNPHEKGSIAYKAWERGIKQAATSVWAPKPVMVDPKAKTKKKK
jgi:hypothetical protein